MPPQNNPQVPPAAPVPPAQQSSMPDISVASIQNNQKLKETIKTFAIYGTIMWVVSAVAGMVIASLNFADYYNPFSVGALIYVIIYGVIGSAIGGLIFYYIYDPVHNWVKQSQFLSRYIHDMFTLFWRPFLVVTVITAIYNLLHLLGLGAVTAGYFAVSIGSLLVGWVIALVVRIAVYYWYAKTISAKLTSLYPW